MSRSMLVALTLAVLCAMGAVGCFLRASALRSEARWLKVRGDALAAEYASSFNGDLADSQLATFDEWRDVLERVLLWQRLQLFLVFATVVSAFSSYVLYLFHRLREQLVEATEPPAGTAGE